MRRLLFAIGLIILAVVALTALGAPKQPDSTPTPDRLAFDVPTRIPAPTTTPGPPQPTNVAVNELREAFDQTAGLTSLRGELVSDIDIQPEAGTQMSGVMQHATRLTLTEDGAQLFTDANSTVGGKLVTRQLSDMIILGTTEYMSSTVINGGDDRAALPTPEVMGTWLILPPEQAAMARVTSWPMWLAQMIDVDHDLPLLILQGQETVSGIACDRYFTDKAAIGPAGAIPGMEAAKKELSLWYCADGNIRRIETSINLAGLQNPEAEGSLVMRLELIETPTSAVITAPANAKPMKR